MVMVEAAAEVMGRVGDVVEKPREYVGGDVWWATTLADVVCHWCSGQGEFEKEKREVGSRRIYVPRHVIGR